MKSREVVSKHKAEWTELPQLTPADKSVDGPLLGNGDMCVAMGGTPKQTTFILCKNDLWRLEHGYGRSVPLPLGRFSIVRPGFMSASHRVEQDLYTATTVAEYENANASVRLKSYVAAEQNLLVIEFTADGRVVNIRASLTIEGGRGSESRSGRDGDICWGERAFRDGVDIPSGAAAAWTLLGEAEAKPDGSFLLTPGEPVVLVLSMDSIFRSEDFCQSAIEAVSAISDVSEIRKAHEAWWADYWDKSFVSIDDPVIEKQYYVSLYAMGSCSRDPDFPPPIFGWTTTDNPMWAGDYHLNYNHQAPFYGLARANRLEQADPHDAPFLDFMDRAEWHCREMYGYEGGIYPVGIGPKGIETTYNARAYIEKGPVQAEHKGLFFGQRTNGSYGLVNMAPRWYCTYDLDYAKKVYPFVLQMATFWVNYLRWESFDNAQDGDEGERYVIDSDSIHEGSGPDFNNCLSIGLIRNAMLLALDMSKELKMDVDRHEKWQHIIEHLCDYSTQEREGKQVFRYSEKGVDWRDGNTLGIQQIYPAGQVDLDSEADLLTVARNTIEVMQRWHDFNGSNSFFPAAVRLGHDAETVLRELKVYAENARPNGFRNDNAHGIENLSTVPNTINEMLCMGHRGVIRLFPVWPKERDASFINIRCWGAFLVSGELKDGVVQKVSILSEKGRDCTMVNPWPGKPVRVLRNGEKAEVVEGERFTLKTAVDEVVELTTN